MGSPARRLLAGGGAGACCGQPRATAQRWLVWGVLAVGSPARRLRAGRGACVLLRDVPVTCRAWGSVSRALRPDARRSLWCPAPQGASFRSRPRRGSSPTRPPGEGCVADPSLASTAPLISPPPHREGVAALREAISKRRVTAGRSARQQGLREQGRSHRFITAGCLRGRVAPPLRTTP